MVSMNKSRISLLFAILIPFLLYGCSSTPKKQIETRVVTKTEFIYRVPEIPKEWLTPEPVPNGAPWKNKTQKDVAEYIINLHKSLSRSNQKIISIRDTLDQLRKEDSIKKQQENQSNQESNIKK